MKKIFIFLLLGSLVFFTQLSAQTDRNALSDLAKIKEGVKSKRVSSYDTTGEIMTALSTFRTGKHAPCLMWMVPVSSIIYGLPSRQRLKT
ncbi:MAG: hypothetical protein V5A47_11480 [Bacteroidales bacterium]